MFGDADALPTAEILSALHKIDDAPWGEMPGKLGGKPLNDRGLAQRLKKYDVSSTNIRHGADVLKGYRRADFADAFTRYLSLSPIEVRSSTAATPLQTDNVGIPPLESATAATPLPDSNLALRFGPGAADSPALTSMAEGEQ